MGMSISSSRASVVQMSQPISPPPAPVAAKPVNDAAPSITSAITQSLSLNTEGYLGTLLNMQT